MKATDHGLSTAQVATIRAIMASQADRIERVALFGSRATGSARSASDVDLVVFGPVDEASIERLWTDFDESDLPFTVDVVGYRLIENPSLKAHIDAVARTLFTQDELSGPLTP